MVSVRRAPSRCGYPEECAFRRIRSPIPAWSSRTPEVVRALLREPGRHLLGPGESSARHQGPGDGEAKGCSIRALGQRVHGFDEHREGGHRPARLDQVLGDGQGRPDLGGRGRGLPPGPEAGAGVGTGVAGGPAVCACVTVPGPAQDSAADSAAANAPALPAGRNRGRWSNGPGARTVAIRKPGLVFVGYEAADHPYITAGCIMLRRHLKGAADLGRARAAEGGLERARAGSLGRAGGVAEPGAA